MKPVHSRFRAEPKVPILRVFPLILDALKFDTPRLCAYLLDAQWAHQDKGVAGEGGRRARRMPAPLPPTDRAVPGWCGVAGTLREARVIGGGGVLDFPSVRR